MSNGELHIKKRILTKSQSELIASMAKSQRISIFIRQLIQCIDEAQLKQMRFTDEP